MSSQLRATRSPLVLGGLADQLVEQRRELCPLPGVGRRRRHERIGEVRQRGGPLRHGAKAGERVEARLEALEELGQAPGQVDVAAVHVVERECGAEETLPLVGHRHPEQNPVEPRLPRVGRNPLELERAPVRGIEAPAHERAVHPFLQPVQVVVAETETAAHRITSGQVQHLGRRDPGRGELEHLGQDAHHRVGLAQRAVGQPDLERPLGSVDSPVHAAPAEGRLNQRREGLDVGHITMMSRGSSDGSSSSRWRTASRSTSTWRPRPWHECTRMLSSSAASNGRRSTSPPALPAGRRSARMSSWICCSSVGASGRAGSVAPSPCGTPSRARAASRGRRAPTTAAADAAPRRRWGPRTGAGGATSGPRRAPAVPTAPATGAGGRGARRARPDRLQHVEVARRKPGQPEQGQAGRMRQQLGLVAEALAGVDQALRRARLPDPGPQQAPQLHLPGASSSSRASPPPSAAPFRAGVPRSGRRGRPRAGCSRTASTPARSRSCGCAGPTAPARARRSASRRLRAGATPPAGAARGPSPGSVPAARPGRRSPTTRETGSRCWRTRRRAVRAWRRGAPTGVASASARCRGSGTETTSAAMGSSRGSATTSRSIPTSASARSDRWTCSTPAEYVGGVSVRPGWPASLLGGPRCRATPCRCWRRPRAAPRWSAA